MSDEFQTISEKYQTNFGHMSDKYQAIVRQISEKCQTNIRQMIIKPVMSQQLNINSLIASDCSSNGPLHYL